MLKNNSLSSKTDLTGHTILVTRPVHQAEKLIHAIQNLKAKVLSIPTIEIQTIQQPSYFQTALQALSQADVVIFVSQNAVEQAFARGSESNVKFSASSIFIAVGEGTGKVLQAHGIQQVIIPKQNTSEGILALPDLQLQRVNGQIVVLFRGEGGRNLIADQLIQRGAKLLQGIVYRRVCPQYNKTQWLEWQQHKINAVIAMSGEALENNLALVQQHAPGWLDQAIWLVVSKRIRILAIKLGIASDKIYVVAPREEDILHILTKQL